MAGWDPEWGPTGSNGGSLTSIDDVNISSDTGATGTGDIIFKTAGVERARFVNDGELHFTWDRVNGTINRLDVPVQLFGTIECTDTTTPSTNIYHGIKSRVTYGTAGTAAIGTAHALSLGHIVTNSGNASNEHAVMFGYLRYDATTTPGRGWFADWGVQGAVATQQSLLNGPTLIYNNYYNGDPSSSLGAGFWIGTYPQTGPGIDNTNTQWTATTYPVGIGLGIVGQSSASGQGFKTAIQIGGSGTGWAIPASRFGTGIAVQDFDTYGIHVAAKYTGSTALAIVTESGSGAVSIGSISLISASALLSVTGPAADTDPLVVVGSGASGNSYSILLKNSAAGVKFFVAGSAGAFITGTAQGDVGFSMGTAGKKFYVGPAGGNPVLSVAQAGQLGFFSTTTVAQQSDTGNTHTVTAGSTTTVFTNTTFDGSTGSTAYTVGDIVKALKAYGLLAA